MRHTASVSALVLVLFSSGLSGVSCTGCDGPAPAPPGNDEDVVRFELFDTTRVLEGADLSALASVDEDGTLYFTGTPTVLADVAELDVILAEPTDVAPAGLMRFVTSTEEGPDGLVVYTRAAPVQMAFRSLEVTIHAETPTDGTPVHQSRNQQALSVPGNGGQSYSLHEPLFNVDGDDGSADDQVFADGTLHGGLSYVFSINFDWTGVESGIDAFKNCLKEVLTGNFSCEPEDFLPDVRTGLEFEAGADAELAVQGVAFLGYDATFPIYSHSLPPIVYPPLAFFPSITVEATFHGEATSQFSFEMSGAATASGGVSVSTKNGIDLDGPDFDYEFSAGNVDALLAAESSFEVGPELKVLLYKVMGPSAGLKVGARLEVDRDETPCYRLFGTVSGEVGVYVGFEDLPGFTLIDESVPFSLVEEEFDSGDCLPLPNNGAPSAHAGAPDLAAFQDPQFAPWSRVFPGSVDGMPVEDPGAQAEWSALVPTIDGRFWITGSDADALISMEPDGSMLWARRYTADVPYWPDLGTPKLLLSRAAPMSDGTMLVAAYPYTLLRLNLAGELLWSRRFMKEPFKETWLRFTDLVRDGGNGFYLVGNVGESYSEAYLHDAWLMHLDQDGDVLWSRRVNVPGAHLSARALVADEDGVVVVGDSYDPAGARAIGVALRIDEDGTLVWAKHLVAQSCADQTEQRVWLTSAQRTADGDVVAGAAIQAYGFEGALVRIKPDGDVPSSGSHRASDGAHLGPLTTSLVELPTSGFLAAGNYSGAQATDDWYLAGLDAAGGVQWAWTFGGHDNPIDDLRDSDTYPSIQLTQDGGALLLGFTQAITPAEGAWVMKTRARSGEISLDPATVPHAAALALEAGDTCIIGQEATVVVTDDVVAPIEPLTVFVEDAALVPEDIAVGP